MTNADSLIATIPQVDGGLRRVYAQDARHARTARAILRHNPAMIDYLHGVDGIRMTVVDWDTEEVTI
jgi:hypothetical protein